MLSRNFVFVLDFFFIFVTSPIFKIISSGCFLSKHDIGWEIQTCYGNNIQNFFKIFKPDFQYRSIWDLTNH